MWAWLLLPLSWLAGVACQLSESKLRTDSAYAVAAVSVVLVLIMMLRWNRGRLVQRSFLSCLCLLTLMLAWSTTGWRAQALAAHQWPKDWGEVQVRVRIVDLPQPLMAGGWRFDAELLDVNQPLPAHPLPSKIRLFADAKANLATLKSGQIWSLVVRLHEPDGLVNPGGFDPTRHLFEQGIRATGQVRHRSMHPQLIREASWWHAGAIDRFRQAVRERIRDRVGEGRAAGVLVGLAVGDQSAIDRADWDVFRRTGVAHAVSISGAHIAMFGWVVAFAVRRVWPRWMVGVHALPASTAARVLAVLISALYALVAGWGIPAQRTVLMMAVMAGLHLYGRRWPWPLVWVSAAAIMSVFDPMALWQPGFWLSFVAVAILMSSGMGEVGMHRPQGQTPGQQAKDAIVQLSQTQWRVTWALAPLALVCFQEMSLVSLLANLVAIPIFTFGITPLALLGCLLPPLWDVGAGLVQFTSAILTRMAQWPWAVWSAPVLPMWAQALAVIAGWLWVQPLSWQWRCMTLPCLAPMLALPQGWHMVPPPVSGQFVMLAVDIGQGTAVLVRTARHNLLFDTGAGLPSGMDMGERVLAPMLRHLGVSQLDALVISHADHDHVGGALSVMKSLPVMALHTSLEADHPVRTWHPAGRAIALPHVACAQGQRWQWDGVQFEFLHPISDAVNERANRQSQRRSTNGQSCVLKVSATQRHAQARSVLLTGDIEAAQEAAMLRAYAHQPDALRSTVLLAPHHGSQTSSTLGFLKAVQPVQTVVQAGRRNRYGHPAPKVLARYQALEMPWVSSPTCGAYLWRSDERWPLSHVGQAHQPVLGLCWKQTHSKYWDFTQP